MNPNYRTLHNDIGMVQRTNNGWDLWFDNGDLVKAEDFHSLQVGIIIACLTSWNYMNRYGNPTYEVFGNRAYELLKANKGNMVAYKIQQYFIECLNRMRRVYEIIYVNVSEVLSQPHTYFVEFEVISISNQLVDGSFTISTDIDKSTSYIEYNTYMPYASNENDLIIDLWLKNEYGGGLGGEVLYMYLKRGDDDYEFRGVVGQTDETGYLRVTYNPWDDEDEDTRHSGDDANVIYFDFHGNTMYNPSTSKRTQFRTELFTYHVEFIEHDITTNDANVDLKIRVTRESMVTHEVVPMEYTTVTIISDDGKIYDATTDANGEALFGVKVSKTTKFNTYYNDSDDEAIVTVIKRTPVIDFTINQYGIYVGDTVMLRAVVTDYSSNPLGGLEVIFNDGESIIGTATTDKNGVAILSLPLFGDGSHEFTASVEGTAFINHVVSQVRTVNINKHTSSLDLTVDDSSLLVGNDIVFIADVTENGVGLYGLDVKFYEVIDNEKTLLGMATTTDGVAKFSTNELSDGWHTIYAEVVETDNYYTSSEHIDVEILHHDYSLEITGAIVGVYNNEYTAQVSVALYDNGVLSDGVLYGNDREEQLSIECNETEDMWSVSYSNSSRVFETVYTTFEGDTTSELTFTATWGTLTSSLSLELPATSTKILANILGYNQTMGVCFGYLYDGNDQPLSSQTIHVQQENPSRSEDVITQSNGYFTCPFFYPQTAIIYLTYDGNYIYSSSTKTLNPRDSETLDDIQLPNNQN